MRDTAIGGLAVLLNRPAWRNSAARQSIAPLLSAALRDANPLVRMHAASAVFALHADVDPEQRASAIGELAVAEKDQIVRATLIRQLAANASNAAATVDTILERLIGEGGCAEVEPGGDLGRGVLGLLTYLALVPQTPFASRTAERWCMDAPAHAAVVKVFVQHARGHLAPSGGVGQPRAFRLLGAAADASLVRWTRDPNEHVASADLSDDQRAELRGAVEVAHEIAREIYFASGAFDEKQGRERSKRFDVREVREFANLAFPVLETCAKLRVPQCVQAVVETIVFLAPLDEAGALRMVADAVPADGPYASDSLAGGAIIPYLERLLAEQRPLVLFDEDGVSAFRHLLATFAAAGNQAALGLAYTFADVFR